MAIFKLKKVRLNDLTADELSKYCGYRLIGLTGNGNGCEDCPFYNESDDITVEHRCIKTIIYNNKKAQELIDKNIELEVVDNG